MSVYFIRARDSGNIKIGFTAGDPRDRLRGLQTAADAPLEIITSVPGDKTLEAALHARFSRLRIARSEWFRPGPELLRMIGDVLMAYGKPGRRWHEGPQFVVPPQAPHPSVRAAQERRAEQIRVTREGAAALLSVLPDEKEAAE